MRSSVVLALLGLLCLPWVVRGDTSSSSAPVVADVLKLTKEKVDEEIIVAFVNNSGGASLSASEIIDLQSKGVSSRVLVALLNAKQQAGGGSPAAEKKD